MVETSWTPPGLELLKEISSGIVLVDATSREIVWANPYALERMGRTAPEVVGSPCTALFCPALETCPILDENHAVDHAEREMLHASGARIPILKSVRVVEIEGRTLLLESFTDLTAQKRAEAATELHEEHVQALLELAHTEAREPRKLVEYGLEVVVRLSRSEVGYLHTVTPDEQHLNLVAWSRRTLEQCTANHARHYPLADAGIWADCVRQRRAVLHNDYPTRTDRKGLPEGHFPVRRHMSVPVFDNGKVVAVVGVGNKTSDYSDGEATQLSLFASSMWRILQRRQAERRLAKSVARLRSLLGGTIQAITRAVEIRDPYTAGHQRRVSDLARAIATELRLHPARVDAIRLAGLLHDIGKIAIPSDILTKPDGLNKLQMELVRQHSVRGAEILETISYPRDLHLFVRQHHERLDGSGYPDGIKGDAISLEARILGVADVMEAMVSHRPYRPAHGIEEALLELARQRGIKLDQGVVDACTRLFRSGRYSFDR